MPKIAFEDIKFRTSKHRYRAIQPLRPVKAWDTETFRGRAFLMCDSLGHSYEFDNGYDYLSILADNPNNRYLNFFYNINFDVRAILSDIPKLLLEDLYTLNEVDYEDIYMFYLPRKFFKVRKGKRGVSYFDLYQFCNCSLEDAGRLYVGEGKIPFDMDMFYYRWMLDNNRDLIKKYCLQDAKLTAKVGEFIGSMFKDMKIDFNKPYSCASVSAQYFSRYMPIAPFFARPVQQYAWNSFHGGRFECFQRGYFNNAYKLDIKSAYPFALSVMPDITKGYWLKIKEEIPQGLKLGFFKVRLQVKNEFISPLHHKDKGLVVYPRTKREEYFITLQELEILKLYSKVEYELIDGWVFVPKYDRRPYEDIITLFNDKERYKDEGLELAHTVKIILNSIYGKTCEVIKTWEKVTDKELKDELTNFAFKIKHYYKKVYKSGKLFNPVYASYITAFCRKQVLEQALKYPDDLIAIFTDALISKREFIPYDSGLGDWELEDKGRLILLGSGVYQFLDNEKKGLHIRGFKVSKTETLETMLEKYRSKDVIPLPQTFALSLGKYLLHSNFSSKYFLNEFVSRSKALNINFDNKRLWDSQFLSCSEVLNSVHHSITRLYRD